MPQIDLPLSELKNYMGKSPLPKDFDEYWDRALKELDSVPTDYTLERADFQANGVECYHMYFTGVGGAKIHAKFLKPAKIEGKAPALLLFHGYQGHSRDFFEKLPFALSGVVVAALDARGQAGLSEDNGQIKNSTFKGHIVRGIDEESPDKLLFRSIFLDTVQLARIVSKMDFVDEACVDAAGFSMGGALTVACSALFKGIRRSAVGYPFLSDYVRVCELDLVSIPYEELKLYFRLRDPLHKREDEFFNRLGYIDIQNLAPKITNEVRLYTGLKDVVCPPSTQFAAYNKITSKKSLVVYPDFDHEELPSAWQDVYNFVVNN